MAGRLEVLVRGIVQGVGFRPFVHSLARGMDLKGYVTNTGAGVLIEVEGPGLEDFVDRLRREAPPLSMITDIATKELPGRGYGDFVIRPSSEGEGAARFTLVSPDVSTCDDCLRELLDPADRRYRYPFINCTNCGPRYSITKAVPYDRPSTTMAPFAMCPECGREYRDPGDRRFHAQPNACPTCGPHLEFRAGASRITGDEAVLAACLRLLEGGGIVAIKGLGGFHLACDARDEGSVERLRARKKRGAKPFAVMVRDLETARRVCILDEADARVLTSARRPIVLLRRREPSPLARALAPGNDRLGLMLPYTPLHHLLFRTATCSAAGKDGLEALVMTSGNLAEEPIAGSNEDAFARLSGMVDGFVFHDREIFARVDDSVVRTRSFPAGPERPNWKDGGLAFVRRSRGYAPDPILLSTSGNGEGAEALGCGADLKNTFTLTKGGFAIMSQHIGDMENEETLAFFEECLANLSSVYRVEPKILAHDLHPDYLSTRWAKGRAEASRGALRIHPVQHHHAHVASVMAEHGLEGRVIGVAFDGTGYGSDGRLWGGEFLVADAEGFERFAHLAYLPLPGGEASIREPWRTAVSLVREAAGDGAPAILRRLGFMATYGDKAVGQVLDIAGAPELSPPSSAVGRLFDAVSALLGICDRNSFEGEAALALENWARPDERRSYPLGRRWEEGSLVLDPTPMTAAIIADIDGNRSVSEISSRFHATLAVLVRDTVLEASNLYGLSTVALGGGAFQNASLLEGSVALLRAEGLEVYLNDKVPCNDASISLGQAWLAREALKKGEVRMR